jgi:hypothetical protein
MSTPENVSYFGRFFLKFVEIVAAGLATAVSGYLIAHLSGVLPAAGPAPVAPVIQAAPSANTVSSGPAQASPPDLKTASTPISLDNGDQRLAPQLEPNSSPVAQPARRMGNVSKPQSVRKRVDNAPDQGFVSQIRAALMNADANRADPPVEASPRQPSDVARPPAAGPSRQQPPFESSPAAPVEIQSRPVVDPQSAPASADKDVGLLSTLEQMLRQDPLAGAEQAPRPPLPVGQ